MFLIKISLKKPSKKFLIYTILNKPSKEIEKINYSKSFISKQTKTKKKWITGGNAIHHLLKKINLKKI